MKEHGILFNRPMIHALKAGRKTQTRRLVTVQPPESIYGNGMWYADRYNGTKEFVLFGKPGTPKHGIVGSSIGRSPYGDVGDHLYVKETFATRLALSVTDPPGLGRDTPKCIYRADLPDKATPAPYYEGVKKWTPAIHMPRAASRFVMEITEVRVQHLCTMSDQDAIAEGLACVSKDGGRTFRYGVAGPDGEPGYDGEGQSWNEWHASPRVAFHRLWDDINGVRGFAWTSNPWVWAYTFKRVV